MEFKETDLKGCFHIAPKLFKDKRGYFFESFNQKLFENAVGHEVHFKQDNQSRSSQGVIRGLHLQLGVYAQAKLVRAIEGKILDVAVDVREDSPTLGKYVAFVLSAENNHQLYIPRGFAHGFSVLSEFATIHYKADNYYAPEAESGIIYNDSVLGIDWQISKEDIIVSEKDLKLPTFEYFKNINHD